MKPVIYPHQYFAIKKQVLHLVNDYHSVNDQNVIKTVQALALEKINQIVPQTISEIEELKTYILDKTLTRAQVETYFENLKGIVIPFKEPSNKQVEKVFRKTKKLKLPNWDTLAMDEHSYVGWNDPGSQKKFILYYQDEKLQGLSGSINPNIIKNVCVICQKVSPVAMFLTTTKTSVDGTYTKKGNYICADSEQCNQQLHEMTHFNKFVEEMKK